MGIFISFDNVLQFILQYKWPLLVILIVGYMTYKLANRSRNLPPGPVGWPIIGAGHCLTGNLVADVTRLAETYGDIISLYLGPNLNVYLNNYEVIKEVLGSEDFAYRQFDSYVKILDLRDEIFSEDIGEKWQRDKKFLVSALRSLGFGTASAEDKIQTEVDALIQRLLPKAAPEQGGLDLSDDLACASASIICNIIYNQRYEPDDKELHRLLELIRALYDVDWKETMILEWLPMWLSKCIIPGTYKKLQGRGDNLRQLLIEKIRQHTETYTPGQPRDFMDVYIEEKGAEKLDEHVLAGTCITFLLDAIDTLSSTICYALLLLTKDNDIQKKIHQEIDQAIGKNRRPTLRDRENLPYLEAFIQETLRFASPAAMISFHSVDKHVQLRGYTLPPNCNITVNLIAVHHNPKIFPEPHIFKPDRFLDSDGNLKRWNELIPFGYGRRKCIGESLVRMEMFLFLANFLQRCDFTFPVDQLNPSTKPMLFYTSHKPQPFRIAITERTC